MINGLAAVVFGAGTLTGCSGMTSSQEAAFLGLLVQGEVINNPNSTIQDRRNANTISGFLYNQSQLESRKENSQNVYDNRDNQSYVRLFNLDTNKIETNLFCDNSCGTDTREYFEKKYNSGEFPEKGYFVTIIQEGNVTLNQALTYDPINGAIEIGK